MRNRNLKLNCTREKMCSDELKTIGCICLFFYSSKVKAALISGSRALFSESGPCLPTAFPSRKHLDGILITSSLFLIYRKRICVLVMKSGFRISGS